MNERTRRLFFALWPDESLRQRIADSTRDAVRESGGRAILAENLHITLVFLGAIQESRIEHLPRCARAVSVDPFELTFGRIAIWKRQALLCLEPAAVSAPLLDCVERLRSCLEAKHFTVEHRPFRAHITLAREVRVNMLSTANGSVNELRWPVSGLALVESTPGTKGSHYRVLADA